MDSQRVMGAVTNEDRAKLRRKGRSPPESCQNLRMTPLIWREPAYPKSIL
jgi:hypothetical protein